MKAILRKVGKARFLGPAVIVVVALVLISNLAYAFTTSNLRVLSIQEDQFYNYDFLNEWVATVENFEWGNDGTSLSTSGGVVYWTVWPSGYSTAEIDTEKSYPGSGTRSGKWYGDGTHAVNAFLTCPPVQSYGFHYLRNNNGVTTHTHGDATHRIYLQISATGAILYYDTTWRDTGYSISNNTWYWLEFRNIDWTTHTFDIYWDGYPIKTGASMQADGSGISKGRISFWNSGANSFWIDDILVEGGLSSGVACAATMVFYNNAEIDEIKATYAALLYPILPIPGTDDWALLNDGDGWIWDSDLGVKFLWFSPVGSVFMHLRVYAPNPPDYMSNSAWGKYVIGTTHCDEFPEYPLVPWQTWHGYHELAEEFFVAVIRSLEIVGYSVYEDSTWFFNQEDFRVDIQPDGYICIWDNDGDATTVYVP
jgi:hypothetical protein